MYLNKINTTASSIGKLLNTEITFEDFSVFRFSSLDKCTPNSITFVKEAFYPQIKEKGLAKDVLLIAPKAFCTDATPNTIYVDNPMQSFGLLIRKLCDNSEKDVNQNNIHPTAAINPSAKIHPTVKIGAYSIIEACNIGNNTIIGDHVKVYDGVTVGANVVLHDHTLIGTEDFGPIILEDGSIEMFPQIGNLIIGDHVEIFPFTAIGRGTINDTVIENGVKVDHCCQIGHNCHIGKNTVITANSIILGSTVIGENTWVGSGSIIKNQLKIGNDCTIGIGAVVTKSVEEGLTVVGNPAQDIELVQAEKKRIKELLKQ